MSRCDRAFILVDTLALFVPLLFPKAKPPEAASPLRAPVRQRQTELLIVLEAVAALPDHKHIGWVHY